MHVILSSVVILVACVSAQEQRPSFRSLHNVPESTEPAAAQQYVILTSIGVSRLFSIQPPVLQLILLESFFNFGPFLSSSCFHNPPPETVCILLTAPTLSPSHTAAVWLYLTDGFVNVGVGRTYRCILNVSHNESTRVRYYPEVLT